MADMCRASIRGRKRASETGLATPGSSFESKRRKQSAAASEPLDYSTLKQIAKRGGPNLENLRGYPKPNLSNIAASTAPSMPAKQISSRSEQSESRNLDLSTQSATPAATSESNGNLKKKKKIGPYNRRFEPLLKDLGIRIEPDGDETFQPLNFEEIIETLRHGRDLLSVHNFGPAKIKEFREANLEAISESQVLDMPCRILSGSEKIKYQKGIEFDNLTPLDDRLTVPRVDWYDGRPREEISVLVRNELSKMIEPSKDNLPCLPNFVVEVKSTKGTFKELAAQALYHGTLSARAVHEIRSFVGGVGREAAIDNKAYVVTAAYLGGPHAAFMRLYTVHPTLSEDEDQNRSLNYHMYPIAAFDMSCDEHSIRRGIQWFRNARLWAKEQRDELVRKANERAKTSNNRVSAEGRVAGPATNHAIGRDPKVIGSNAGATAAGWNVNNEFNDGADFEEDIEKSDDADPLTSFQTERIEQHLSEDSDGDDTEQVNKVRRSRDQSGLTPPSKRGRIASCRK